MPVDASFIQRVPPPKSVEDWVQQQQQIDNSGQVSQQNALKLAAMQQDQQSRNEIDAALRRTGIGKTPAEYAAATLGLGQAGTDYGIGLGTASSQNLFRNAQAQMEQHKVMLSDTSQGAAAVMANPTADNAIAVAKSLAEKYGQDPTADIQQIEQLRGNPEGLYNWAAGHGQQADRYAKMLAEQNMHQDIGGADIYGKVSPLTGKVLPGAQNIPKTPTPGELLTDKRQRELQQFKVTHGIASLSPEEQDALDRAINDGRLDPNRINSRTAAIYAGMELKNPGTNFAGISANMALARNPNFRNKALTAETLPEIMQNVVDAGKKLNMPNTKIIGQMKAWALGQTNDPQLQEFMTLRNDSVMTIANVMRQVGMSDKAVELEKELTSPSMTPAALDAWLSGQMKSLKPRLDQYNRVIHPQNATGSAPTTTSSGAKLSGAWAK